ncbi:hypothetical protein B0F90DRAFT_1622129 [Multifurca ochricompacta]|uniref:DUF6534 domain-containing protein n=1 Tax=Multifurca ochricompacta TaxID=376703 RepID=A0AAD4MD70_9AGAM|nr:hypothetical protein B0F90DRAFT_1622129 [Multifurca ochricompacta]
MASPLATQTKVPTNGPILVEGALQALCQGVIFAQAARYWECPLNDTMRMKSYVLTLVGLSLLQTMLTMYKLWYILIYLEHWSTSPLVWADLFLNGLICTVCETSLLRKCCKAPVTKKKKWVILPLGFLLVTIFIANIYLVSVPLSTNSSRLTYRMQTVALGAKLSFNYWIFGSLVLDVTITSILMVWLWHSKTGLDNLDKALNHIISVTWGSAAVPSAFQIIAVSLYNSRSEESRHLVLFFLLMTGKFYTLGILRSLNSRPDLRDLMTSDDFGRRSLSDWRWNDEPDDAVAVIRRSSEVKFYSHSHMASEVRDFRGMNDMKHSAPLLH